MKKKFIMLAGLSGALFVLLGIALWYISREVVVYQNNDIDGYGFRALVTCHPDEMFTYYPYLKILTPGGVEVARAQINARGYEASEECRASFPVVGAELTKDKNIVRLRFKGRNAFGDTDSLDVPVRYFSVR